MPVTLLTIWHTFRYDTIHGKHDITIEIHSHSSVVEGHKMA